jgi:hypothetical protein
MPMPHVRSGLVPTCRAHSKRTGLPCQNMCAFGSPVCRMHGARRPESISRGMEHPNYRHGNETRAQRAERRRKSFELHQLVGLGNATGLFGGKVKLKGRKPNG